MNTHQDQRQLRQTRPTVEDLDSRIAPAATSAATLAAELRVESRQVSRWEASLATARPGSREQIFLTNHIARTEGRLAVQEARLALEFKRRKPDGLRRSAVTPSELDQCYPADEPREPRRSGGHPIDAWPPFYPFGPSSTSHAITSPSVSTIANASPIASTSSTTTDPTTPAATSLPANVSQTLGVIYAAYQANPSDFPADIPATNGANRVEMQGTSVGITLHDSNAGDFNTFVAALQSAGMQITDSSAQYGVVDGFLPVAQLPAVASLPDAPAVMPLYQPSLK